MAIDENAFGILISYFGIDDEEYALEREQFIERFEKFRALWQECVCSERIAESFVVMDLGHALYIELAEDELMADALLWIRNARTRLSESEFESVGVISHGGRWRFSEHAPCAPRVLQLGSLPVHAISLPSEPLRHALDADAAARMTRDGEIVGWGPGFYAETEALEALGRKLKNVPTPLEAGGAMFYRIGK